MPNSHLVQNKILEAKQSVSNNGNIPSAINASENLYYVNGLLKNQSKAEKALDIVNVYFSPRRFKLIYNDTLGLPDLQEIKEDYQWLIQTATTLTVNTIIPNDAMYRTMAILEYGRINNSQIGLIGSSQGSIIIYNAVLGFYLLSQANQDYLKTRVKIGTVGSLIPSRFYGLGNTMLQTFSAFVNRYDVLSTAFTMDDINNVTTMRGAGAHSIKWYLPNNLIQKNFHRLFTGLDPNEPFLSKDYFD